ncbi:MAG: hypothetical protein ACREBU_19080 [Nitrososphaera sp.]
MMNSIKVITTKIGRQLSLLIKLRGIQLADFEVFANKKIKKSDFRPAPNRYCTHAKKLQSVRSPTADENQLKN